MTDLAPLHSEDAERSVLGGLLFRPALIGTMAIEVRDFYSPRNQAVFEAMRNLDANAQAEAARVTGLPLDRVIVHNHVIGGGFGRTVRAVGGGRVEIAERAEI